MNELTYAEKLKKYGKKTICKEQLAVLFSALHDEELYPVIESLQESGLLEPIQTSKTNGNRSYPIFLKYRILLPEESFSAEQNEISGLHPRLQNGDILRNKPKVYRRYRREIRMLDRYLFSQTGKRVPVSRKERSFEIFGEEKRLDDKSFCRLLEKLGLGKEVLAFYDTPEYCFPDFIPERKEQMTLLICENKDIWFNLRRRMFEDRASVLFDTRIDGVVYGCGNQISENGALTSYTDFLGGAEVTYLYWGDIDRAGLNIYQSLVKNNPGLQIALFLPAYEYMLTLSQEREIPDSEDHRDRIGDYTAIEQLLSRENRERLQKSIQKNKRIPQEIVTYENLLKYMR